MKVVTTDYPNVFRRIKELGLNNPTGIAILPRHLHSASSKEDLVHESSTATIRKLFKDSGLQETPIEIKDEKFCTIQENDASWIGPTIFISSMIAMNNPASISIALNVISNYVTEYFSWKAESPKVKLNIIIEKTPSETYKKLEYKGDVEGLSELPKTIKEIMNE